MAAMASSEVALRDRRDHVARLRLHAFLHTSGKWPASFTIRPAARPCQSAHDLQALREAEPGRGKEAARLAALAQHVGDGGEAAPAATRGRRHGAGG